MPVRDAYDEEEEEEEEEEELFYGKRHSVPVDATRVKRYDGSYRASPLRPPDAAASALAARDSSVPYG